MEDLNKVKYTIGNNLKTASAAITYKDDVAYVIIMGKPKGMSGKIYIFIHGVKI